MGLTYWIEHFYRASLFAKAIYAMLFGLSLYAWAIMFRKVFLFRRMAGENDEFFGLYRKNRRNPFALHRHLQQSHRPHVSPLVTLFMKACDEMTSLSRESAPPRQAADDEPRLSTLQIENLEEVLFAEMDRLSGELERGQTFLATTSSVSPLLGLLGTVWGILEAFRSIGVAGSATASSMAPGMAEALITTVAGLVVAIPANLGYNFLGQRAKEFCLAGDNFITEFITNLKRFGEPG